MSDPVTGPAPASSAAVRWSVFGVLLALLIGALGFAAVVVMKDGEGSNPIRKVDSLISPAPDPSQQREEVLAAARDFVQAFNTYGPQMLDDHNKMPAYAAVADLMTAKFAEVFAANVGYAEQTVVQTKIDRVGTVQGVGIASFNTDTATALAAGTVQFSYPDPKDPEKRVDFAPVRFRYEVSLVLQKGRWLVDDLDDVDDDLPSFGEAGSPQTGVPGGTPPAPDSTESSGPSQGAGDGTGESPSEGSGR